MILAIDPQFVFWFWRSRKPSKSIFNDLQTDMRMENIARYREYSSITISPTNTANDSPIKCIAQATAFLHSECPTVFLLLPYLQEG